ncbi:hypothetical protein KVR01_000768 [Diaporthe batatas]|uniref:uncharacterized protein n=1 Tax=Diaporthe batatas TaxID=748121 RepID=UPI001D04BADD|nr:uncharacterized protein KVR01_000768 [Diaporthe batatas]KAG8170023.1 hypothetical protein KVR01_000768 [Diaporthe batatas]
MQKIQHTDRHLSLAKKGDIMPITIEENPEEAMDAFARLVTLGHFSKATALFDDILKNYIDELPVFAEYANFLIQQGMYSVLLDRVKERSNMKTASKCEEDEILYLELLQALSLLHFEGKLLDTLEILERRRESYATMIKSRTEPTYIQIRSVEIYLAIIAAIILVVPERSIKYEHNVTVELSRNKTYVLEIGALGTSRWGGFTEWCDLLVDEHPNEAVNIFRTLLPVIPADERIRSWAQRFASSIRTSGPEYILAAVGAMNAMMRLQARWPRDGGAGTRDPRDDIFMPRRGMRHDITTNNVETSPKMGFDLLEKLYVSGYDARSHQAIELELSAFQSGRKFHRLRMGLEGLADIAREEANYRLESRCLQLMVEVNGGKFESPISAILPMLSSGALYSHFAQDAIELINLVDRFPSTDVTTLQTSVSIGSLAAVRIALDRGDEASLKNQPHREAQTSGPIHQAARKGYEAIAQVLCDHDKTILSDVDENGYLPLHVAAENGHENLLPLLLGSEKNIDIQVKRMWRWSDSEKQTGSTALHLASANGHEKAVALLLHCKAWVDAQDDRGWTALHKASARWQYGTANLLLRHGADVNLKTSRGVEMTAVELAAKSGFTALVDLILQHQSPSDCASDGNCGRALILAVENRDLETASLLLEHTKDIQDAVRTDQLADAVRAAARKRDIHLVELLLKHGADETAAIHESLTQNNAAIFELLLESGADIAARNDQGRTALTQAIYYRQDLALIQILMARGADVEAKDNAGKTALHHAIDTRNKELIQILVDRGVDIEAKDNAGETVLHHAIDKRNKELIKILIDRGVDIEAKDNAGKTVLHHAIDQRNRELIQMLQDRGVDEGSDLGYKRTMYNIMRTSSEDGTW